MENFSRLTRRFEDKQGAEHLFLNIRKDGKENLSSKGDWSQRVITVTNDLKSPKGLGIMHMDCTYIVEYSKIVFFIY